MVKVHPSSLKYICPKYEDTAEAIERVQDAGAVKTKSHKMKDGYRY